MTSPLCRTTGPLFSSVGVELPLSRFLTRAVLIGPHIPRDCNTRTLLVLMSHVGAVLTAYWWVVVDLPGAGAGVKIALFKHSQLFWW